MSLTPGTLLLSLAVASPALWAALVRGTMPAEVALERLVIIVLVVSVSASALRGLVHSYSRSALSSGNGAGGQPDRRDPARRVTGGRGPA
jgi:hypothetical protein